MNFDIFNPTGSFNTWVSVIAAYITLFIALLSIGRGILRYYVNKGKLTPANKILEEAARDTNRNIWRIAQIQSQVSYRITVSVGAQICLLLTFMLWVISLQKEYKGLFELSNNGVFISLSLLSLISLTFAISSSYSLLILKKAADIKKDSLDNEKNRQSPDINQSKTK